MRSNNKTIKFFISSTFKDFLKERNALQTFVFPRLKKLCQSKGFAFQPVDLRWGVTHEFSDDNQTMNFCLNEVKRCTSKPRPNLLVLLGQRYGWGPLPFEIDSENFITEILDNISNDEDKLFLEKWYLLDENSVVPIRYLKNKKGIKTWDKDEKRLQQIIKDAVEDNSKYVDYFKSATELEIRDALKQFKGNKKNTLVYIRAFSNICDSEYYEDKKESQDKLTVLKDDLRDGTYAVIEKNNLDLELYKASDKNLDKEHFSELSSDLQVFCNEVFNYYHENILEEIDSYTKASDLTIELQEQKKFLSFKSKVVLGRKNEVKEIKQFILNSDEQCYLLHGRSGSGKSSVMAKVIADFTTKRVQEKFADKCKVIYRFIGTTEHTTSPRDTYECLYWELAGNDTKPIVENEDYKFYAQFRELLESYNKQIIIFIDAVDQFNTYDNLSVFLDELPKNVKLIFSTLNKHYQEDNLVTLYYKRLTNSISNSKELDVLTKSNDLILTRWLDKDRRKLTINQKKYLLNQCKNKTPLYLRLTFMMAKEWKSSCREYENDIKGDEQELILKFFKNLEKDHYHKDTLIERVLGLISASKNGLSESELIGLLSKEEDILRNYERNNSSYPKLLKLPDAIFSRLYFHMQEFFTEKLIDGEMLITPFHRIISETIKGKYYKEDLHKKLADYFLTLQDTKKVWDERYNNTHMLSETPYQLFHAKDSEGLKDILFDLEFSGSVYNKNKQKSFRSIMEKATQLDNITKDEMYVWESFYKEKEHLITKVNEETWKAHQSLFQLAYEDGLNSHLSRKAEESLEQDKVNFLWLKNNSKNERYIRTGIVNYFSDFNGETLGINICTNNEILLWDKYSISMYNIKTREKQQIIRLQNGDYIELVKVLSMNELYIWTNDNSLLVYNLASKSYTEKVENNSPLMSAKIIHDILFLLLANGELQMWKKFTMESVEYINCRFISNFLYLNNKQIISWDNESVFFNNELWEETTINNDGLKSFRKYFITDALELNNGNIITYSLTRNDLIIYNIYGKELERLHHQKPVNGFLKLTNNNILSWSKDKSLAIWNEIGKKITLLKSHDSSVVSALELKHEKIISWSEDNIIKIWSGENYKVVKSIKCPGNKIFKLLEENQDNILVTTIDMKIFRFDISKILNSNINQKVKTINIISNHLLSYTTYDKQVGFYHTKNYSYNLFKNKKNIIGLDANENICFYWNTKNIFQTDGLSEKGVFKFNKKIHFVKILDKNNYIVILNDGSINLFNSNWEMKSEFLNIIDIRHEIRDIVLNNNSILFFFNLPFHVKIPDNESNRILGSTILYYPIYELNLDFYEIREVYRDERKINGVIKLTNDNILVYGREGKLKVFNNWNLIKEKDAHQNYWVKYAIEINKNVIMTIGGDSKIMFWNQSLELLQVVFNSNSKNLINNGIIFSINSENNINSYSLS